MKQMLWHEGLFDILWPYYALVQINILFKVVYDVQCSTISIVHE